MIGEDIGIGKSPIPLPTSNNMVDRLSVHAGARSFRYCLKRNIFPKYFWHEKLSGVDLWEVDPTPIDHHEPLINNLHPHL